MSYSTLLLDQLTWDLVADANGNIAMAGAPYSQAQSVANALRTFQGEVYFDTTQGVPYWSQILGKTPPLSLVKAAWQKAALTVPHVVTAKVFIAGFINRKITGQIQVTNDLKQSTAVTTAIPTFTPPASSTTTS